MFHLHRSRWSRAVFWISLHVYEHQCTVFELDVYAALCYYLPSVCLPLETRRSLAATSNLPSCSCSSFLQPKKNHFLQNLFTSFAVVIPRNILYYTVQLVLQLLIESLVDSDITSHNLAVRCTAFNTHTTTWNTCCHNTAKLTTMYCYRLIVQKCDFSQAQCRLPVDGSIDRNM